MDGAQRQRAMDAAALPSRNLRFPTGTAACRGASRGVQSARQLLPCGQPTRPHDERVDGPSGVRGLTTLRLTRDAVDKFFCEKYCPPPCLPYQFFKLRKCGIGQPRDAATPHRTPS